ncbi:hypothetical protein D5086_023211 [Populus alba]|uniref:Uncharacterized protein n=1 Tax=Populus alba TaxID=43335 RepID=A0ACC4B9T2_POPAL
MEVVLLTRRKLRFFKEITSSSIELFSRDSSVGFSSRRLYYRSAEGVPFKWEMQPGTPKDPSKEEIIPPIRPPPALLGIGLPKPCIDIKEPKTSMRSRFRKLSRIFESASARHSMQKPHGCIPWNSTAGLISVAKRNR